jgi:hypothetical protein
MIGRELRSAERAISSRMVIEEVKMPTQKRYGAKRRDNVKISCKINEFCQKGKRFQNEKWLMAPLSWLMSLPYSTAIASQPEPQPVASALSFPKIPNRLEPLPVMAA